jgi:hypothetical protein
MTRKAPDDGMQGVGDPTAAKRFRGAEERFVPDGPVELKAREAARRSTARRPSGEQPPDARLDDRLKESFPASDPASSSPGSD